MAYRPRLGGTLFGIAFFGVCSLSLACEAATNARGLVLKGVFTFSPQGATIFYWVLCGFAALFVVAAASALLGAKGNRFLELTPDALLIPRGYVGTKLRYVPYYEIVEVTELSVTGSKSLGVRTSAGQFWIPASVLPSNEDYRALKEFLMHRAPPSVS
jgi:hypothetical protein